MLHIHVLRADHLEFDNLAEVLRVEALWPFPHHCWHAIWSGHDSRFV